MFVLGLLFVIFGMTAADVYLHNPRGSNNRLDEESAARQNANRLFDSQNNNRGGYNVGDKSHKPAGGNQSDQYRMKFFQSGKYVTGNGPKGRSELLIEWTNQHGCGGNENDDPHEINCNIVIQMMCQDESAEFAPKDGITLRDGSDTDAQKYTRIDKNKTRDEFESQREDDVLAERGLQEPWSWYDDCSRRERNKGLFTADQNMKGDSAIYTRQNSQGERRGYECPEERDYYPYWHPSPFVDIAVLAQNASMCKYYESNSFNRRQKHACVENFPGTDSPRHFSEHNNQVNCTGTGGRWTEFYNMLELAPVYTTKSSCEKDKGDGLTYKWGKPWNAHKIDSHSVIDDACFVLPPKVECQAAKWSRPNHLGNGREGVPLNYTWTIPYFPSQKPKRCILRIRYNISTDDYDPYFTDSSSNGDASPIRNNPLVTVKRLGRPLRLAIDTAQTGRTFQDRSHAFILKPRPGDISNDQRIVNLNVRGKRGNSVQTFPAVEYDFIPNRFAIRIGDLIHVQWTGSNSHVNGPPGQDGETGNAGAGETGTDRHNILQTLSPAENFPIPFEGMTMWKNAKVKWSYNGDIQATQDNIALILASAGYYECIESCPKSVNDLSELSGTLDNANASFEGVLLYFEKRGEYFFLCTRNNNFTNRSQKGHLIVQ